MTDIMCIEHAVINEVWWWWYLRYCSWWWWWWWYAKE